jgi:ethanolamine ammonia-lyase small subunit
VAAEPDLSILASDLPELVRKIRERTPARLLTGRVGAGYCTQTQIELREAHAAARDAVRAEMSLETVFDAPFTTRWGLFEVPTAAMTKEDFLLQPDLGRRFSESSRTRIQEFCPQGCDLQIAIGDGLSVPAVSTQVPPLLEILSGEVRLRGWKMGRTFEIRHCRVGILNEIGELLDPLVAVLLIGERPGLATAESLSAYMAYKPRKQHTDANRNLISNIHARGVRSADAAIRIVNLAAQMMKAGASGYTIKEERPELS